MPLNLNKCVVLHVGQNNPMLDYSINGVPLVKVDSVSDLSITVTSDLSWSSHITKVVKKANRIGYLITKAFEKANMLTVVKLYTGYIRPILEFGNAVWYPVLTGDKNLLEGVQRRITRIPFGIRRPSYEQRLSLMNLPTVAYRRSEMIL